MPKVNPDILIWARETAGLDLERASKKLRILEARGVPPADRLAALEAGETEPSRSLLKRMAKQYRRPLVTFYMSAPPQMGERGQDFRKLPEDYSSASEALVDALIRDVQARQSILRAALEDEDEAEKLEFVGSMQMSDGVDAVTKSIRDTLNIHLSEFRRQPSLNDAFLLLREAVESIGVFVLLIGDLGSYHTAINLESFRGFALADDVAPFIVINDRDSKAAWSFTLIHELVHIWLGQTGISNIYAERDIEKFCNNVAGEFLLPQAELKALSIDHAWDFEETKEEIRNFAQTRNLSSSMVAYNLYLKGAISQDTWRRLSDEFKRLWQENKAQQKNKIRETVGGPDYYIVRRHRIGRNLIALVQRMMRAGALTTSKAGMVLGVKTKNVQNLFEVNGANNTSHTV